MNGVSVIQAMAKRCRETVSLQLGFAYIIGSASCRSEQSGKDIESRQSKRRSGLDRVS
jgi:hypothetical protein